MRQRIILSLSLVVSLCYGSLVFCIPLKSVYFEKEKNGPLGEPIFRIGSVSTRAKISHVSKNWPDPEGVWVFNCADLELKMDVEMAGYSGPFLGVAAAYDHPQLGTTLNPWLYINWGGKEELSAYYSLAGELLQILLKRTNSLPQGPFVGTVNYRGRYYSANLQFKEKKDVFSSVPVQENVSFQTVDFNVSEKERATYFSRTDTLHKSKKLTHLQSGLYFIESFYYATDGVEITFAANFWNYSKYKNAGGLCYLLQDSFWKDKLFPSCAFMFLPQSAANVSERKLVNPTGKVYILKLDDGSIFGSYSYFELPD